MKINNPKNNVVYISLYKLRIGDVFTIRYYPNSYYIKTNRLIGNKGAPLVPIVVGLETGELFELAADTEVTKVEAEVNIL
jgi:hypothetical protein